MGLAASPEKDRQPGMRAGALWSIYMKNVGLRGGREAQEERETVSHQEITANQQAASEMSIFRCAQVPVVWLLD